MLWEEGQMKPSKARRNLQSVLVVLLVAVVAIQFIPVRRSNPPKLYADPLELHSGVYPILRDSCYDCHSNVTQWPWYSRVAPVSWLVARDVNLGREQLNFTEWHLLAREERVELALEIVEKVEQGAMPQPRYLILHPEAELTEADKFVLVGWTAESRDFPGAPGQDYRRF